MALISIRLSDWELEALDSRSFKAGVSRSKLVRDALFGSDSDGGVEGGSLTLRDEVSQLREDLNSALTELDLDDFKRRLSVVESTLEAARGF